MISYARYVLVLMMFGASAFGDNTNSETEGRDLNAYEQSGPYTIDFLEAHANQRSRDEAAIREFLWVHWHSQRRALLRVTFYSKEGLPTVTKFFIEPDAIGNWNVVVQMRSKLPAPPGSEGRSEDTTERAYYVQRVTIDKSDVQVIPPADRRTAASYRLALRDKNQRLIVSL